MTELFHNSRDALIFALSHSSSQYPQAPLAKMIGGRVGTGKGLVALDGAGQAGMILAALSTMDPMRLNCIKARYAPKFTDCPCCGGKKPLEDWRAAIKSLSDWACTRITGISHAAVREAIILNFFDHGISISEAAARANVPVKTAYNQRTKIHAALCELDEAAQHNAEDILESHQVIGEPA